jgi:hypothetical protein
VGELALSEDARSAAGNLLLTIVAVEYGDAFMLRVVRGRVPMTSFQRAFARAGHTNTGVLVIAALLCQVLADAADLSGFQGVLARSGVPLAAILFSAGFFMYSIGKGRTEPDLIWLLYAGAAALAAGGRLAWTRTPELGPFLWTGGGWIAPLT